MRVLILSHLFPNRRNATAGTFVFQQAKHLRAAGVGVVVVSPTPWAPRLLAWHPSVRKHRVVPESSDIDGFEVRHPRIPTLPRGRGFAFAGFSYYLSCRRVLHRLLMEDGKIDLIHAHTIMPDGFGAVLLGREFNLPVVCTLHGSDINVYPQESRAVAWATKWALRRVARLITVSEGLKREVIAMIGPSDIMVAHNGADPEIFKPASKCDARLALGLPVHKKILCNIGYLRADNGHEVLLQAFARLERRDTLLCLVGDGPLREALTTQALRLGISDFCIFAGAQSHEQIPSWLAAADGLVLSSLTAGLPTILPEAMLCRVPVIATAVGGIPDIVRAGETGLLVPCRDSEALAQAMKDLLSHSRCAADMADRAYVFAKNALTWNINARKTMAVYGAVMRTSGESGSQRCSHPAPSVNIKQVTS